MASTELTDATVTAPWNRFGAGVDAVVMVMGSAVVVLLSLRRVR